MRERTIFCYIEKRFNKSFGTKYSKDELSEYSSFIFFEEREKDQYGNKNFSKLSLKSYLELIRDSNYPFDYLSKLMEIKESMKKKELIFSIKGISNFCSRYVYPNFKHTNYLIEIKKIEPKKYQYAYEGEKARF